MLRIILTLAIFLILVIPMGKYMYHIATKQKTFADKMFNPIDNFLYKICGIKREDMGWKKYAMSLVLANAVMVFIGYLILRLQNLLFLNPNGADGMGFGDNTKAALITRGIAEMIRYGKACGAKEITFSGLSGIGDLIVTCASKHSRNRHVGECLGKGQDIQTILSEMTMVAEGVPTVKAVYEQIQKLNISMPILEATYNIIYKNANAGNMVEELMERTLKEEFY